jgi:cobalt-zinc-cadmium efflux system protein
MLGGVAILTLDWNWVDPLLSLLIVAYIFWQVASMLPETLRVLMESAPEALDLGEVANAIAGVDGVQSAHHLHAWLLDEHHAALEAHIVIDRDAADRMDDIRAAIRAELEERFDIGHSTLELEFPETAARKEHDTSLVGDGRSEYSS